jgi:glycosyltransferase involved in cell wall biosynthesis
MKICLISVEIFAWGKYGGFGRAARTIGRELSKRGIEVYAVVPRRKGQKAVEFLDGITVYGFSPLFPWTAAKYIRDVNADIYHSCEPSFTSYLALRTMPHKKHMVTFRDPRDLKDWKMEFDLPSLNRLQVVHNYFFENNILVRKCIKKMDGVYAIARYLIPKVKKRYRLPVDPVFLPTPVAVGEDINKATVPTVCYLARLDRRKRPALFLDLAEKFPHVDFLVAGKSRDRKWESSLYEEYSRVPNISFLGFLDQFHSDQHSRMRNKSWIMVNTATREALPNSILESAASKCAILSHVDPDGFASRFGYHAKDNNFEKGLQFLLQKERWRTQGEKGYQYVKKTFEMNIAMRRHMEIYEQMLTR